MLDNDNFRKISLEYTDNVPERYGISELQFTFDFIYLVLKRDFGIDDAIENVANKYGLSQNHLRDYLVENKYILNKAKKADVTSQLKMYSTKALKKILKKHGIKKSGKRKRIEEKILENNLLVKNFYLSSKSRIFFKNKKRRIRIYNEYLCDYYYFNEFNDFYMENYRKKEGKIPIEFIKLHIDHSSEIKDHDSYVLNNKIMAKHYSGKKIYRRMLEFELKNFCMNLNPIWKIDDLKEHAGINRKTYDKLVFLNQHLTRNTIISTYYLIWDSFNFETFIVSKYDGYRCLKDILNLKDFDRINDDLNSRFYNNNDLKIKKIAQKTLFDF